MTTKGTVTIDSNPNNSSVIFALLARYDSVYNLKQAAYRVRQLGYTEIDAYSPFPVHGMEKYLGLKKSRLGWIVFLHGCIGFFGAIIMMYFISSIDYPLLFSGKPFFNIPAFVPVAFELTVLFSAFGATFGMLFLNKLPLLHHPIFNSQQFHLVTDDGFFLSVEASDPEFHEEKLISQLKETSALSIERIYYE